MKMRDYLKLFIICIGLINFSCAIEEIETIEENTQTDYESILLKSVDEKIDSFQDLQTLSTNNETGVWLINNNISLTENITIPVGVTLVSIGGGIFDLNGYQITGQETKIDCGDFAMFKLFNSSSSLVGTWDLNDTPPEWFGYDDASSDIERHKSIQTAISCSSSVKFKGKDYCLEGTLRKENDEGLTIKGVGMGNTRLIFKSGGDGIYFGIGIDPTRDGLKERTLSIKDITIISIDHGAEAAAVRTEHIAKHPGVVFNNVEIEGDWRYGINMTNGAESSFNNVIIRGDKSKLYGIIVKSKKYIIEGVQYNAGAVSYTFNGVSIYNANVGMRFVNETNKGIEGIKIIDCDIVNAHRGIHFSNSAADYYPPQINILSTHINADEINILIQNATQIFIGGGTLLYNTGIANGNYIKLTNVSEFRITDMYCAPIGNNDIFGIVVQGNVTTGLIEGVMKRINTNIPAVDVQSNGGTQNVNFEGLLTI